MGISLYTPFFHPTGRGLLVRSWCITPSNYFLRVIPTLTNYADIVSDTPSVSIYCIYNHIYIYIYTYIYIHIYIYIYICIYIYTYVCIIYIHMYVLYIYIYTFWHSFWHILWHSIWHSFWHLFLHSIWRLFSHSIWNLGFSLTFFSCGIFSVRVQAQQRPELAIWGSDTRLGSRRSRPVLFLLFAAGGRPVGEDSLEILAPSCREHSYNAI